MGQFRHNGDTGLRGRAEFSIRSDETKILISGTSFPASNGLRSRHSVSPSCWRRFPRNVTRARAHLLRWI